MKSKFLCLVMVGTMTTLISVGITLFDFSTKKQDGSFFSQLLPSDRVLAQSVQSNSEQVGRTVYQRAISSVVEIRTTSELGSGFIVSPDGLILTNAHVVEGAESTVTVVLHNGQQLSADVVGYDADGRDLAILKVYNQRNLPNLTFARPESIQTGDQVFAIGSPLGETGSLSSGVISRILSARGLIQTDAPINRGNSGGPLLNINAEVVGVNVSLINPYGNGNLGIGFAISVEEVQTFLASVQDGRIASTSQRLRNNDQASRPRQLLFNGQAVTGALGENSRSLPNGGYFDIYEFEGTAGQQVAIEMNSQKLDSYLVLLRLLGKDANGNSQFERVIENDDIALNNHNAQIGVTLPSTDTYVLLASTFAREAGDYNLRAREGVTSASNQTQSEQGIRFFCGESFDRVGQQNIPTTLVWIPQRQGKVAIIRWKSQYFDQFGLTPQERCVQASSRFQTTYEAYNGTFHLTTGQINNQPVVCAVRLRGDDCGANYLFALKPTDNPGLVLQQLVDTLSQKTGSEPLYQSGGLVYIDLQDLLQRTIE